MKKLLFVMTVLWGGGLYGLWYWNDTRTQRVEYRTVRVRRGDLLASINATGTIEPVEVVDVGTQVAGRIQGFGEEPQHPGSPISYGSKVDEGTVLARLDDALFKARLDQARANVEKAEADLEQAQAKFRQAERGLQRNQTLRSRGKGMVSDQDLDNSLADYESTKAALQVSRSQIAVAKADLEEAHVNLGYTTIRSPVGGVILDRRVNIGQTVVASLNAPSLFLIAKDLRRLEIWASVNETDIGAIHPGQDVRFTVGAFPSEPFHGKVAQIRLNASMVHNVVTYTVVVDVDNTSGKLLPYLTARLQFEVETRKDVLLVPNAALRWRPRLRHVAPDVREAYARSLGRDSSRSQGAKPAPRSSASEGDKPAAQGTLWTRQGEFVRPMTVALGLSDGVMTEVRGEGVREGSDVIVGLLTRDDDGDSTPFLPQLDNNNDNNSDDEGEKPRRKS